MSDSDSDFDDLAAAITTLDDKEEIKDETENPEEPAEQDTPKKLTAKRKRRRIVDPEEEKELNKFLFGDKEQFIKNLERSKQFFTDVIGETTDSQVAGVAVWHDSDDDDHKNSAADGENLRRKFERINGNNPTWAQLDRNVEDDSDSDDEISKTVGHLNKKPSSKDLPKGELNFKRLANVNKATTEEGRITSVLFHPKSTVGIVSGLKGIVSMFAIDGRENKK